MIPEGWYPIFLREMLLFRRKLLRVGYLFSAMVVPIIYLVTFGLGLGRNVQIEGKDYLSYLIPGLVAMSSMNNSYTWVASSLNLNRLYFKGFQIFVQAPIHASAIMIGEVLAGMVKGLFASFLILIVGYVLAHDLWITPVFVITVMLNSFLFAGLGVITGMITKSHEDTATYNNFFILPMAFFSGTFFPVDRIPELLRPVVWLLPLTHTNILIRQTSINADGILSLAVLVFYAGAFFGIGSRLIRNYSE
ncbi:MAG: ABC transporter permease [Desulfomonilaceae bacterium]